MRIQVSSFLPSYGFSNSLHFFHLNFVGFSFVEELFIFHICYVCNCYFVLWTEGKDPCILANEYQRDVKVLEWRPNGGRTLSVACKQVSYLFHSCTRIYIIMFIFVRKHYDYFSNLIDFFCQGWNLYLVCLLPWECSVFEIWCCFLFGNPLQRFWNPIYSGGFS